MKKSFLNLIPNGMETGTCLVEKDGITLIPDEKEKISFTIQLKDIEGGLVGAKRIVGRMIADSDYPVSVISQYFKAGEAQKRISLGAVMIPERTVTVDYELSKLDSSSACVENLPGMVTGYSSGFEILPEEVEKIVFSLFLKYGEGLRKVHFSSFEITDEKANLKVDGEPLLDEMGQWKDREWPNKTKSVDEMIDFLKQEYEWAKTAPGYPEHFSFYGGCKDLVFDKTGYFHTAKKDGTWYLVDPDGYGFFSNGICYGSRTGIHGLIDGMENLCDWLPDKKDPEFEKAWTTADCIPEFAKRNGKEAGKNRPMFNFARANMIRAFGKDNWWNAWCLINTKRIKKWGYNTINIGVNNYYDEDTLKYLEEAQIPFIWTLKHFPLTKQRIYRDFPDVFSKEYEERAAAFAEDQLSPFLKNPFMIGYFETNEPEWHFEKPNMAERTFACKGKLESRLYLIEWLRKKYQTIDRLNAAWKSAYSSFEELDQPVFGIDKLYPAGEKDFTEMHDLLILQYETVVHNALKAYDPDHLDLGMRYGGIGRYGLSGIKVHDLLSFTCYDFTPKEMLDIGKETADIPSIIGEWHIGADKNGKYLAGVKAARTETDRGQALANYMQSAMTHSNCVGIAYFEFNDQPFLGRFDGECFQIGLIDICNKPYKEVVKYVEETGAYMYDFRQGKRKPDEYTPDVWAPLGRI